MLTDVEIRALRPAERAYKRGDEKGLFLLVRPTGTLIWRLKYHRHGIERTLSLGHYPEVGLKHAREKRDEAGSAARPNLPLELLVHRSVGPPSGATGKRR